MIEILYYGVYFMKKKIILSISLFIISLFAFSNKVNAFDCKYYYEGKPDGDPVFVLQNVNSSTDFTFNPGASSDFTNNNLTHGFTWNHFYDLGEGTGVKTNYILFVDDTSGDFLWTDEILTDPLDIIKDKSAVIFIAPYLDKKDYEETVQLAEKEVDKCPKVLEYQHYTDGMAQRKYYTAVFPPGMNVDPSAPKNLNSLPNNLYERVNGFFVKWTNKLTLFKNYSSHGNLILDAYKDKKAEDLIGENCRAYDIKLSYVKDAVNEGGCDNNQSFNKYYEELKQICDDFRQSYSYSKIDDDDYAVTKNCSKLCTNFKDDIADICKLDPTTGCNSLGPKVVKWIYKVIKWLRYIIPVIIIILVMLEYIKALASEDEKAMKDATSHMFTRLMVAAIIFILPFILDFIISIFNIDELDINNLFCQK
jgi:hypothetical protein